MRYPIPASHLAALLGLLLTSARAQQVSPKPISMPSPGYPVALTDTGYDGQAEVDVTIKKDGSVADPELMMAMADVPLGRTAFDAGRAFGMTAMSAVAFWKFRPGTRDGVPVDMRVTIPFHFPAPQDQKVNAAAKRKVYVTVSDPILSLKDYGSRLKVKKDFHPIFPRGLANPPDGLTVEVSFVVAPDGTTLNPSIVGTPPPKDFVIPALVAVAAATYAPPLKDGKGVYVQTSTKLHFEPEHDRYGGSFGGGSGGGGHGH